MVFPLLWKGVGVCRSKFDSSNRLEDRSINNKKPKRTKGRESDVINIEGGERDVINKEGIRNVTLNNDCCVSPLAGGKATVSSGPIPSELLIPPRAVCQHPRSALGAGCREEGSLTMGTSDGGNSKQARRRCLRSLATSSILSYDVCSSREIVPTSSCSC